MSILLSWPPGTGLKVAISSDYSLGYRVEHNSVNRPAPGNSSSALLFPFGLTQHSFAFPITTSRNYMESSAAV